MKTLILCFTLGVFALTGCSSKELFGINSKRSEKTLQMLQKVIPDEERASSMQQVVKDYEREVRKITDEAIAVRNEIVEVNRNYGTSREELQALYDQLGLLAERLGNTARDYSLKLRSMCTEEEWKQITSDQSKPIHFTF